MPHLSRSLTPARNETFTLHIWQEHFHGVGTIFAKYKVKMFGGCWGYNFLMNYYVIRITEIVWARGVPKVIIWYQIDFRFNGKLIHIKFFCNNLSFLPDSILRIFSPQRHSFPLCCLSICLLRVILQTVIEPLYWSPLRSWLCCRSRRKIVGVPRESAVHQSSLVCAVRPCTNA